MEGAWTSITTSVTNVLDVTGDVITFVIGQPLLLVFFGASVLGVGIKTFKRLV